MPDLSLYIARNNEGNFEVKRPGSKNYIAILSTQNEAVEVSRNLNPDADIFIEKIIDKNIGGRDKWIKV